jgi:hypothetical protein
MALLRNRRIVPHAVRIDKMNEIADIGGHIDEAASLEACMGGVPSKQRSNVAGLPNSVGTRMSCSSPDHGAIAMPVRADVAGNGDPSPDKTL